MTIPRQSPVTADVMANMLAENGFNITKLSRTLNEPRHMCEKWMRDFGIKVPDSVKPFSDWNFDDITRHLIENKTLVSTEKYVKETYQSTGSVVKYFKIHNFDWRAHVKRPQNLPPPISKEECVKLLLIFGFKYHKIYAHLIANGYQGKPFRRWLDTYGIDSSHYETLVKGMSLKDAIDDLDSDYSVSRIVIQYSDPNAVDTFRRLRDNKDLFTVMNSREIAQKLNVPVKKVLDFKNAYDIPDASRPTSNQEIELRNSISAVFGVNATSKRFKIGDVIRELDIYIDSHKLGIEFNGSYWHSDERCDRSYHVGKTEGFKQLGITVLHVFDFDNRDIVMSMIANKLNMTPSKVYARKCVVKQIPPAEANEFCDRNHIQGSVQCSIAYGLYYNDKLVYVMTLGKSRFSKKHDYEILRACSELYTNVIGGFSKVFSAFLNDYDGSVITYANLRYGDGAVYTKSGFTFLRKSPPSYFYSNGIEYKSRYECQRHKLNDTSSDTEETIMRKRGYFKIYDCGNNVYEFRRKK